MGKSVVQTPRGILFPPTKPRSKSRAYTQRAWYRTYRARILARLELCRKCGARRDDLTFDHIIPASLGEKLTFNNATILCWPCNNRKADALWHELKSLAEEEKTGTPWTEIAIALADAYEPHRPCEVCGQWDRVRDDNNNMLVRHAPSGVACLGGSLWRSDSVA